MDDSLVPSPFDDDADDLLFPFAEEPPAIAMVAPPATISPWWLLAGAVGIFFLVTR